MVEDALGECMVVNCIAQDQAVVTFNAETGGVYYLIVDGSEEAIGTYHIAVACTP